MSIIPVGNWEIFHLPRVWFTESVWRLKRVTIQLALCCYQQNLPNDTSVLCMVVNLKILDIFDRVNLQYKILSNIMCRRFMKRFGLTQLISLIQLLENSVDMWFHSDCWISSMLNIKVLILYFTIGLNFKLISGPQYFCFTVSYWGFVENDVAEIMPSLLKALETHFEKPVVVAMLMNIGLHTVLKRF